MGGGDRKEARFGLAVVWLLEIHPHGRVEGKNIKLMTWLALECRTLGRSQIKIQSEPAQMAMTKWCTRQIS